MRVFVAIYKDSGLLWASRTSSKISFYDENTFAFFLFFPSLLSPAGGCKVWHFDSNRIETIQSLTADLYFVAASVRQRLDCFDRFDSSYRLPHVTDWGLEDLTDWRLLMRWVAWYQREGPSARAGANSNISFDLLQNITLHTTGNEDRHGQNINISFGLLQNTRGKRNK